MQRQREPVGRVSRRDANQQAEGGYQRVSQSDHDGSLAVTLSTYTGASALSVTASFREVYRPIPCSSSRRSATLRRTPSPPSTRVGLGARTPSGLDPLCQ